MSMTLLLAQLNADALIAFFAIVLGGGSLAGLLSAWLVVRSAHPQYTWKQFTVALLGAIAGGVAVAAAAKAVLDARNYLDAAVLWSTCGAYLVGTLLGACLFAAPARMVRWMVRAPQVVIVLAILSGASYVIYDSFRAKSIDELVAQAMLPDRPQYRYQDPQRFRLRKAAWDELERRGAEAVPRLIEITEQLWDDPAFPKLRATQVVSRTQTAHDERCVELLVRLMKESPGTHPRGWESPREQPISVLGSMGPRARGAVPALLEQIDDPDHPAIQPRTQQFAFKTLLKIDPGLASHPTVEQFLETYAKRAESADQERRPAAERVLAELKKSLPKEHRGPAL